MAAEEITTATFRLTFDDELKTIAAMTEAAKPLEKTLTQGMEELNGSLGEAKADPNNPLKKSRFETKHAECVRLVVEQIDDVLGQREQTLWAFEDAAGKLRETATLLKHATGKSQDLVVRKKSELQKIKDELRALKTEAEKLGGVEKLPAELQSKLRVIMTKYRVVEAAVKGIEELVRKQGEVAAGLAASAGNVADDIARMKEWFEQLQTLREGFVDLADRRNQTSELEQVINTDGVRILASGPQRTAKTASVLFDIGRGLNQTGKVLADAGDVAIPSGGERKSEGSIESELNDILKN
jgi:hypothetical protein